MAEWHTVGPLDMLADGQMQRVDVDGKVVLLARVQGTIYATQARCPHLRALLTRGTLEGAVVTCPAHGSRFDVTTGACIAWVEGLPGLARKAAQAVSKPEDLATYPTREQDGQIWVKL